jgi:hypothetical protein
MYRSRIMLGPAGPIPFMRRLYINLVIVSAISLGGADVADAKDQVIPRNQEIVDCGALGVGPGDTITLEGPTRGNITIRDCYGESGSRIKIQNDSTRNTPLVIEAEGDGGFRGIECVNCEFVTIDGTGKWVGAPSGVCGISSSDREEGRTQCGIQIVRASGNPNTLIRFRGSSKNFTLRGIEIDGRDQSGGVGIGLSINDKQYKKVDYPGEWRENIRIENNYIHDTYHEGMYIGHNYGTPGSTGDIDLRNIVVQYNLVENTGFTGIQVKSALDGDNSINHNHIYYAGWVAARDNDVGHANGAAITEGSASFYSNLVVGSGGVGFAYRIQYLPSSLGKQPCEIFNNVIVKSGRVLNTPGISVWRKDTDTAMPVCEIYNNTVAMSENVEVNINDRVVGTVIRDNILADNSGQLLDVGSSDNTVRNNLTGVVEKMGFWNVNELDFRLTDGSPAINQGGTADYPTEDHNGVPRPQAGAPDQGAFEYVPGGELKRPNPPALMSAQ